MRSLPVLLAAAALAYAQSAQPPAPVIPPDVDAHLDVEYSNVGQRVAMDIFRPKAPGPNPTVVAIHGGGFRAGSRASYIPLCIKLAQKGYAAATVQYRLAPRHQFPAAVEDVKAAVRFLRANAARYGVDPNRIGTIGGSAGGHLALMLGLTGPMRIFEGSGPNLDQSSAVQAVVNYYGPTDFTQSYGKSVDAAEVLPMFLGGGLLHERRFHIQASPLYYVTPQAAPTLTIHGTEDKYVAYEHALWLTSKLLSAEVPAELETLSGAGHGFKGADAEKAEARAIAWFDRWLKPAAQTRVLVSDHGPRGEVVAMLWPSGQELWTRPNKRGHDVQPLPNGNVLYTVGPDAKVIEFDPKTGKEVWTCCEKLQHPLAAQRLANGNTLIGDPKAGRVFEVNPAGAQVWEYANADLGNMRTRNSHRTATNTTLVAVEADAKLIELDRNGKIVWQWQAPEGNKRRMYMGRRLANGNTMMSLSDPGEVVEVDPAGKVVRSIGGAAGDIRFGWASGFDLLPNGNLLIADYTGRRLVEVDPKGRVVNQLRTGPRTIATVAVVN
ncbi:MAG: alpha/beta hydrolase fold domain-containing protein [Bryobacterales bacterium]|nr:alpha/beta hydrolase fold domain-containing protein [Bryobacterales bacterium]